MSTSKYLFHEEAAPDTRDESAAMLEGLAGLYDPFSGQQLRLAKLRPDARCLVVAVGASRIATTLAEMVPQGEIIATDIDLDPCQRHPLVQLLEHNIVTDPLPAGNFDLVHVRLLLGHLAPAQRESVLARLASVLSVGGVLIVEEFEATWRTSVLDAPDPDEADRLFEAYHDAFQATLRESGNDLRWGRRAHGALRALGLEVETRGHTSSWRGGQAGCQLPRATLGVIRERLIAAGMAAADIDALRELLLDPRLVTKGNLALSHVGRRRG